jgi:hypothetical protein
MTCFRQATLETDFTVANRDLTNFRTVVQQAVEEPNRTLEVASSMMGALVKESQEARIAEGMAEAQMRVTDLETRYRIDNEGDPLKNIEDYKKSRREIFSEYEKEISPFYRPQWREMARKVETRNDLQQQGWSIKQTRTNTVNSINRTIKSGVMQAQSDGMSFGKSDENDVSGFINFANTYEGLMDFASQNLGSETAQAMLENYEEDYMKSFLSGVSESNPVRAAKMMDEDYVREAFSDPSQYIRMKDSMNTRAKRYAKAIEGVKSIDTMIAENELMPKVGSTGYAELQQKFAEYNMSEDAQNFYSLVNGYSSVKRALTNKEKTDLKSKVYSYFGQKLSYEEVDGEKVFDNAPPEQEMRGLQDTVYMAMTKGALTKDEGFSLLNNMIAPELTRRKNDLEKYEAGDEFIAGIWRQNYGFPQLEKEISRITGAQLVGQSASSEEEFAMKQVKNNMYEYYIQSLEAEASDLGINMSDISRLPYARQAKIYTKALKETKMAVNFKNFPSLASSEKPPNSVLGEPVPNIGDVIDGGTYLGGNPNDPKSWRFVE